LGIATVNMKALLLDIEYDYGFSLFGVVSPIKDYKLAWALNKLLGLRLIKQQDLCYDLQEKERLLISHFEHNSEHTVVRLFGNKSIGAQNIKKAFLLPDLKEFDYVLQVTGGMQECHPQEFMKRLVNSPMVQYVKQFDPLTLTFRENLIF
jgi:hypothetical protein